MTDRNGIPRTPAGLGPKAARFWREINREFVLTPQQLLLLGHACQSLDLAEEAHHTLAKEGLFTTGRYGVIEHPACKTWLRATRSFRQTLREIGTDLVGVAEEYSRPPLAIGHGLPERFGT